MSIMNCLQCVNKSYCIAENIRKAFATQR